MKRKKRFQSSLLCLTFTMAFIGMALLFSGCGSEEEDKGETMAVPVERSSICHEDFRITFSTPNNIYIAKKMDKEAPLHFEIKVEYLGDEPEVKIFHSSSLYSVILETEEREALLDTVMHQELGSTVLKKNEPFIATYTGKAEYDYLGSIPKGSYQARAAVEFYLDEGLKDKIRCSQIIPFTVK